jgi:hypothetical protein
VASTDHRAAAKSQRSSGKQARFRGKTLKRYGERCVVCGRTEGIEANHVRRAPRSACRCASPATGESRQRSAGLRLRRSGPEGPADPAPDEPPEPIGEHRGDDPDHERVAEATESRQHPASQIRAKEEQGPPVPGQFAELYRIRRKGDGA